MAPFLIVFLALQLFQTTTWAKVDSPSHNDLDAIFDTYSDFSSGPLSDLSNVIDELPNNNINNDLSKTNEDGALDTDANSQIMQTSDDEAVLQFRLPIKMAHLDQVRNAVVLKFQSPNANLLNRMDPEEFKRLRTLQENSIRLGKRSSENYPRSSSRTAAFFGKNPGAAPERSHQVVRDLRGDNFMRFGRSGVKGNKDFMRFGRAGGKDDFMRFGRAAGQDFMRFGRSAGQDFMRFGRDPGQDFMRFGRDPGQDFMRFGRAAGQDFMRFGRDPGQDFMRFGRDPGQDFMRFGRAAGQDFMRFGRDPGQDFMRFGRDPGQDFMRFGRSAGQDFMRFGRDPGQDFMRFGRDPGQDFMRFGRDPGQDFMRFGRDPGQDFMRFGRSPSQDFMRFGRSPSQDFMRFGRSPPKQDFMRFGRSSSMDNEKNNFARYSRPDNFMRFGRTPPQQPSDFMRFGKSPQKSKNQTSQTSQNQLSKNELKQAVKLIHEADNIADRGENPVDKAIKVLFDKHQQQNQLHTVDDQSDDTTPHEDSGDLNMDMDYILKMTK